MLLGRGEDASQGRTKKSILANVYEAIVAAVYYDGGYHKAFPLIEKHFKQLIVEAHEKGVLKDYKSRLQEYSQSKLGGVPAYEIVRTEGPDHDKLFEVHVTINSTQYETGLGRNKKAAEQEAAKKTLQRITGEDMNSRWWRFFCPAGAGSLSRLIDAVNYLVPPNRAKMPCLKKQSTSLNPVFSRTCN